MRMSVSKVLVLLAARSSARRWDVRRRRDADHQQGHQGRGHPESRHPQRRDHDEPALRVHAGAHSPGWRGGRPGSPGSPWRARSTGSAGRYPRPTLTSGEFGVIYRNTIGSPVADLRSGPADPARGSGSLSILVAAVARQRREGLIRRFDAWPAAPSITEVGFRVYTTGENVKQSAGSREHARDHVRDGPEHRRHRRQLHIARVVPAAGQARRVEPVPRRDEGRALGIHRLGVQLAADQGRTADSTARAARSPR